DIWRYADAAAEGLGLSRRAEEALTRANQGIHSYLLSGYALVQYWTCSQPPRKPTDVHYLIYIVGASRLEDNYMIADGFSRLFLPQLFWAETARRPAKLRRSGSAVAA
ncbi:unnamed protein product, partial [Phaeothamnion confervicola]